jgi:hypothetical protein
MFRRFRRQRSTENLLKLDTAESNTCATGTDPSCNGQICVEAGSLIPVQNFCEGESSSESDTDTYAFWTGP